MKSRAISLLGRSGSILLVIGFALGLVYMITPIAGLVPRERALTLIKALIVSGMVLALPWAAKKTTDYVRSR